MSHVNQVGDGALKETRMVRIHKKFVEIEGSPDCWLENVDVKLV